MPILAVPILGLFLLNLAFVGNYLIQRAVGLLISLFVPGTGGISLAAHIIFTLLVAAGSWLVYRASLPDLVKAVWSVLPMAILLVYEGIFLYRWPVLVYAVGTLTFGAVLIYLYKTKRPWIYYYAVTFPAAALLIMGIMGTDI